jgi:hypothetical protein
MARRALIASSVSVAGVVLAGAAVVVVSFGVLDASSADDVGQLSAAAPATQPAVTATTVAAPGPEGGRVYEVGDAGTVEVVSDGTGISAGDIVAADGWTAAASDQTDPDRLQVAFTRDGRILTFTAVRTDAGIVAQVVETAAGAGPDGGAPLAAPGPAATVARDPAAPATPAAPPAAAPVPTPAPTPAAPPAQADDHVDDDSADDTYEDEDHDEEDEDEHPEDVDHEDEHEDEDDGRDD